MPSPYSRKEKLQEHVREISEFSSQYLREARRSAAAKTKTPRHRAISDTPLPRYIPPPERVSPREKLREQIKSIAPFGEKSQSIAERIKRKTGIIIPFTDAVDHKQPPSALERLGGGLVKSYMKPAIEMGKKFIPHMGGDISLPMPGAGSFAGMGAKLPESRGASPFVSEAEKQERLKSLTEVGKEIEELPSGGVAGFTGHIIGDVPAFIASEAISAGIIVRGAKMSMPMIRRAAPRLVKAFESLSPWAQRVLNTSARAGAVAVPYEAMQGKGVKETAAAVPYWMAIGAAFGGAGEIIAKIRSAKAKKLLEESIKEELDKAVDSLKALRLETKKLGTGTPLEKVPSRVGMDVPVIIKPEQQFKDIQPKLFREGISDRALFLRWANILEKEGLIDESKIVKTALKKEAKGELTNEEMQRILVDEAILDPLTAKVDDTTLFNRFVQILKEEGIIKMSPIRTDIKKPVGKAYQDTVKEQSIDEMYNTLIENEVINPWETISVPIKRAGQNIDPLLKINTTLEKAVSEAKSKRKRIEPLLKQLSEYGKGVTEVTVPSIEVLPGMGKDMKLYGGGAEYGAIRNWFRKLDEMYGSRSRALRRGGGEKLVDVARWQWGGRSRVAAIFRDGLMKMDLKNDSVYFDKRLSIPHIAEHTTGERIGKTLLTDLSADLARARHYKFVLKAGKNPGFRGDNWKEQGWKFVSEVEQEVTALRGQQTSGGMDAAKAVESTADRLQGASNALLEYGVELGYFTKAQALFLREKWPMHVPMHRMAQRPGSTFFGTEKIVKQRYADPSIKGGQREAMNLWEDLIGNTVTMVDKYEKNYFKQKAIELYRANGGKVSEIRPISSRYLLYDKNGKLTDAGDQWVKWAKRQGIDVDNIDPKVLQEMAEAALEPRILAENQIAFKHLSPDGKSTEWVTTEFPLNEKGQIADATFFHAIRNAPSVEKGMTDKIIFGAKELVHTGVVGHPYFPLKNFIKDIQTLFMQDRKSLENPEILIPRVVKHINDMGRVALHLLGVKDPKIIAIYNQSGGSGAAMLEQMLSGSKSGSKMFLSGKGAAPKIWIIKEGIKHPIRTVKEVGALFENVPRIAHALDKLDRMNIPESAKIKYKKGILNRFQRNFQEYGLSFKYQVRSAKDITPKMVKEIPRQSRDITVDFADMGAFMGEGSPTGFGRAVHKVPFGTAAFTAGSRYFRTWAEHPVGAAINTVQIMMAPAAAVWKINHLKQWYQSMTDDEKNRGLSIGEIGGKVYSIPWAFEWGSTGAVTQRLLDYAHDKDPDALNAAGDALVKAFIPMGKTYGVFAPLNVPMQIAAGYVTKKQPHFNTPYIQPWEEDAPSYEQGGAGTSPLLKDLARGTANVWTGAFDKPIEDAPGVINPAHAQFTVRAAGGPLGGDALRAADLFYDMARSKNKVKFIKDRMRESRVETAPIARDYLSPEAQKTWYSDEMDDIYKLRARYRRYKKSDKPSKKAAAFIKLYNEHIYSEMRQIQKLRKRAKELRQSDAPGRRAEGEKLAEEANIIAREARDAFRKAEKE